jgi:hypothetical protein
VIVFALQTLSPGPNLEVEFQGKHVSVSRMLRITKGQLGCGKIYCPKNVMYACVTLGPKTVKSSWIVYKGLTWPKTCNHCHAIICNCNAVTMFPANALISTTVGSNFVLGGGGLISQGRLLGHYFLLKLYRLSLLYKLLGGGGGGGGTHPLSQAGHFEFFRGVIASP